MKLFTITVTTTGHETYEVKAADEASARRLLSEHNRSGATPKGRLTLVEEAHGEWLDEGWEIEQDELE